MMEGSWVDGSENHKVYQRELKDLKTKEGFAIGEALAALKKYKGRITTSLKFNDGLLSALDKNKETHPKEGSFMKGQLLMFDRGYEKDNG